jgi:cephalosporin hydroxylase
MGRLDLFLHPGRYLRDELKMQYYRHIHLADSGKNQPRWRGLKVIKYPSDMILYSQVIFDRRPDFIIETGTYHGGSAVFFGDLLSLSGGKKVITIDHKPIHAQSWFEKQPEPHERVQYILASSTEKETVDVVKGLIPEGSKIMVVLDSEHTVDHVARELFLYAPLVTDGQYLVVEDCYAERSEPYQPYYAVEEFLQTNKGFVCQPLEDQFVFAVTRGGWLLKVGEHYET